MQISWNSCSNAITSFGGKKALQHLINNPSTLIHLKDKTTRTNSEVGLLVLNQDGIWNVETHGQSQTDFTRALAAFLNENYKEFSLHNHHSKDTELRNLTDDSPETQRRGILSCFCCTPRKKGYSRLTQVTSDIAQETTHKESKSRSTVYSPTFSPITVSNEGATRGAAAMIVSGRLVYKLPNELAKYSHYLQKPNQYQQYFPLSSKTECVRPSLSHLLADKPTEELSSRTDKPLTTTFIRHSVSSDGACLFRAALAIKTKNDKWLSQDCTNKSSVKAEMDSLGMSQQVKDGITQAIGELRSFDDIKEPVSLTLKIQSIDLAELLFNKTISDESFTLYAPTAIARAVGFEQLKEDEFDYFELLAEFIGQFILIEMAVPYSSVSEKSSFDGMGQAKAFAVHVGTNHFDLCAHPNYFH